GAVAGAAGAHRADGTVWRPAGGGCPRRGDPRLVRGTWGLAGTGAGSAALRSAPGAARRPGGEHRARRRRVRRRGARPRESRGMKWLRKKLTPAERPALPEPEVLRSLLDEAVGLPALGPSRSLLGRLADDYARTRALASRPLRIALVGSTGAGESPLLNALARRRHRRAGA